MSGDALLLVSVQQKKIGLKRLYAIMGLKGFNIRVDIASKSVSIDNFLVVRVLTEDLHFFVKFEE